jgi:hypothetical protein
MSDEGSETTVGTSIYHSSSPILHPSSVRKEFLE